MEAFASDGPDVSDGEGYRRNNLNGVCLPCLFRSKKLNYIKVTFEPLGWFIKIMGAWDCFVLLVSLSPM